MIRLLAAFTKVTSTASCYW